MFVLRIITVFKIFVLLFVFHVEGKDNNEEELPMKYNYALVMIDMPEEFPQLPTTVEFTGNKRILKYGSNSVVQYFCPTEDATLIDLIEQNPKTEKFNKENCLSPTILPESSPKTCHKVIYPILTVYIDDYRKSAKCGWNYEGQLFGFKYMVCLPGSRKLKIGLFEKIATKDVHLYQFCYDIKKKIRHYTRHRILSPSILKNIDGLKDLADYEWDKISTISEQTFGNTFVDMKKEIQMKGLVPHLSIPPEDMAFGAMKKSLYHYSNVIGMPKEISMLWKFIDNRIRQAAVQSDSELEIYMDEFLANDKKFWCKLILDEKNSKSAAIIIHTEPTLKMTILNDCSSCDFTKWDGYDKVKHNVQLVRCCETKDEHFKLFGLIDEMKKRHLGINLPNKGKAEKVFLRKSHSTISQNKSYLDLDDFTTDKKIPKTPLSD